MWTRRQARNAVGSDYLTLDIETASTLMQAPKYLPTIQTLWAPKRSETGQERTGNTILKVPEIMINTLSSDPSLSTFHPVIIT